MVVKKKKPVVKKKGRRTDVAPPISNAEPKIEVRRAHGPLRSAVKAGEIKPILDDTIWRVLNEIDPTLEAVQNAKLNSDETGYILMLYMTLGSPEQKVRRGLKISNHEFSAKETPLCRECR